DWVLQDCSLTVRSGERVALVGATGAGKTTIARLLNRFYDVAKGQVLVEGVDVREWDLVALRRHVGLVQQDTVLFTGTIEANLRLGLDGEAARADIARAAEMANARRFIEALPRGWAARGAAAARRALRAPVRAAVRRAVGVTFVSAVHGLVRRIPRGRIATYGQIAASLGRPRAARAVGWAMKHCPAGVPWHRVVNARGGISRRPNAGSMLTQRLLLEQEGVPVQRGRVSLVRHGW